MPETSAVVFGTLGAAIGLGAMITLFGLPIQVVMKSEELALPTLGRKELDTSVVMFQYSASTYEPYFDSSDPKHSMSIAGVQPVCLATISAESVCAQPFVSPNENTTDASAAECSEAGKACQVLGPQFQSDVEELHWALRKLRIAAVLCAPFVAFLLVTGTSTFGTGGACFSCGDAKGACGAILTVIAALIVLAVGGAFIAFLVGVGFALAGGYWVQEERSTVMEDPQVQRVVGSFGGSPVSGSFPEEGPAKATYGWAMSAAIFFGALLIFGSAVYAYLHMDDCLGKFVGNQSSAARRSRSSSGDGAAAAATEEITASEGSNDEESDAIASKATANPASTVDINVASV